MNLVILRFDQLASTNTEALEQARRGADEGLCIVAAQQTAGRGRQGRTWHSPPGAGVYFSIVLRPKLASKHLPLLTLMTAVAIHQTLKSAFHLQPDIKWPNDVQVGGKKISGILAETAETEKGTAVVVGLGINLNDGNFPPEIAPLATSIEQETGKKISTDELLPLLTSRFEHFYDILLSENGPQNGREKILSEWSARSSYHSGKDVRVIMPNETVIGTTCGLEENGALRIKQPDGEICVVQAGDVENLRTVSG